MTDAGDIERMNEAFVLAEQGWGQTSPNPMVGAVVYDGDQKVGEGFHHKFGGAHAEVNAITDAGIRAKNATLYVTLEPCAHQGKTPPCVDAIIDAGISRVVIAIRDPTSRAGGGAEKLRAAGIEVEIGPGEARGAELNAAFFNSVKSDRPWVTLKLALSLDGALADAGRSGAWLTGEESRREVQRMRANSDAIAVGVETAIADNPRLTARTDSPPRVKPTRVVFDRSARLSPDSALARSARETPTVLVTATSTRLSPELERAGVASLAAKDAGEALRRLRESGIRSLLVEGGAGLAASFLAGNYVDRVVIFRAPIILGSGALNAFSGVASQDVRHAPRFSLLATRPMGDDVMSVYAVLKP